MKNVTFSTDSDLLRRAREKAHREKTTLNRLFREWLSRYVGAEGAGERYRKMMERFHQVDAGGKFSREEMNER